MSISLRCAATAVVLAGLFTLDSTAQEWTRFRGPNGTGISEAKNIPVTWTEQDFRWRVAVPGESHSQPVIWGQKIFLTSAMDVGKERALLCLQKSDGKILWTKSYPLPTHLPGNKNSGYANGSPVVDQDRVIACFVSQDHFWVRSFDHSGNELWHRDLGTFTSQHGHGASPMIYENTVIVTNDQRKESFVTALDLKTGRTVWLTPRKSTSNGTTYGTPIVNPRPGSTPELLVTGKAHGIASLDPKTGKFNWEAPVFDKRMCATPVVAGDLVIGSCGQGGGAGNYLA
ncbi:MAG: PQQ-binding-like beta-propeller repeat protein, partial [Phycisphaerales bacterium]|nr:PQQ-binding-like beta-propeller repeat protein [Phycisphaerales bacterium]